MLLESTSLSYLHYLHVQPTLTKSLGKMKLNLYPIGSMYGIFAYFYHQNQPNVIDHTWILWVFTLILQKILKENTNIFVGAPRPIDLTRNTTPNHQKPSWRHRRGRIESSKLQVSTPKSLGGIGPWVNFGVSGWMWKNEKNAGFFVEFFEKKVRELVCCWMMIFIALFSSLLNHVYLSLVSFQEVSNWTKDGLECL